MKQYLIITAVLVLTTVSCGHKDNAEMLKEKKDELGKLKQQEVDLQAEINKLDTAAANAQKAKLVSVQTIQPGTFNHYIKLQGRVDAQGVSLITPSGAPGQVKAIYVQEGDVVKKGQLLLKLDDVLLTQQYQADQQGLVNIQNQLNYFKDIYQRRQNLWKENIGSEVDVINARNNVTSYEDQLKVAQEKLKTEAKQLDFSNVRSDVDGVVDLMTVKVGETFGSIGSGQIRVVNNKELKVVATIPQNYLNNVTKGAPVIIQVPDVNKTFNATLTFVGASVDPTSNGFTVEAKLPSDAMLRPNQVAEISIKDYTAGNAIVVPVETLQNDLNGKFIMVAVKEKGKLIARKRPVTIGLFNDDQLEVKTGLQSGDALITEGFQGLYDGQLIITQ